MTIQKVVFKKMPTEFPFFIGLVDWFELYPTASGGNTAYCYQCIQSYLWYLLAT